MADKMDAVICTDFGEWSVEQVPRPEPADNEALVAVRRVQLSVTECQRFYGEEISGREKIRKQMQEGDGRVFGHEFSGDIVEVGDDVHQIAVGDRVYAPAKISCDECAYCEKGYPELCEDLTTIGTGRPGAIAEYLTVPGDVLRSVPDSVSYSEAAAMQPLASAILCAYDARIEAGDTVAVLGTGVMGAHVGQLALLEGAGDVYAIDVVPEKLDFAADQGMIPINVSEENPIEAIHEATDGIGADVVFSAVGGDQSHLTSGDDPAAQAYKMARKGGTLLQVGILQGEMRVTPREMRSKEVSWVNPRHGVWSFSPNSDTGDLAGRLVADDRIVIDRYIEHEFEGLESFERAVEITENKPKYDALGPAQIIVK